MPVRCVCAWVLVPVTSPLVALPPAAVEVLVPPVPKPVPPAAVVSPTVPPVAVEKPPVPPLAVMVGLMVASLLAVPPVALLVPPVP